MPSSLPTSALDGQRDRIIKIRCQYDEWLDRLWLLKGTIPRSSRDDDNGKSLPDDLCNGKRLFDGNYSGRLMGAWEIS